MDIVSVLISILSLSLMEIVLGIDNVVFISILVGNLDKDEQNKARFVGLSMALIVRVILLSLASLLIAFTQPINFLGLDIIYFIPRDVLMALGGTFLIYSAVKEIHNKTSEIKEKKQKKHSFTRVILNIILIDIVFSFDSILTAIGLVQSLMIMIAAVIISMIVMIVFSGKISDFIEKFPSVKMLALSFLLMIGFILMLDAFHVHVPKGYIYFAMFFSLFVVLVIMRNEKHAIKVNSIIIHDKIFKAYSKNFFNPESEIYKLVLRKQYITKEELTQDLIEYLGNSHNSFSLYLLTRYNISEVTDAFLYAISIHDKELGDKIKTVV